MDKMACPVQGSMGTESEDRRPWEVNLGRMPDLGSNGSTTVSSGSSPAGKSWRTTAWGAALSTGFWGQLGSWGRSRAVSAVCTMDAGFIIHSETFFFSSLGSSWHNYEYKMQTTQLSQTRESWPSGKGMSPCWRRIISIMIAPVQSQTRLSDLAAAAASIFLKRRE